MTEPNIVLTPEQRVRGVAELFLRRMPEDLRTECFALAELDPAAAGIRLFADQEHDTVAFTWMGRWLGTVDGRWLRGDEIPAGGDE